MTGHKYFLNLFYHYSCPMTRLFYTWEVNMARIIDTTEKKFNWT